MRGLLILGVALALLAVFTLPTAQASTIDECNTTMSLNQLDAVDAVAIHADDSGGSLFAEISVVDAAVFNEQQQLRFTFNANQRSAPAAPGGGQQFDESAKQGPQFEDVACRPLRGLLRGIGRGIRHVLGG